MVVQMDSTMSPRAGLPVKFYSKPTETPESESGKTYTQDQTSQCVDIIDEGPEGIEGKSVANEYGSVGEETEKLQQHEEKEKDRVESEKGPPEIADLSMLAVMWPDSNNKTQLQYRYGNEGKESAKGPKTGIELYDPHHEIHQLYKEKCGKENAHSCKNYGNEKVLFHLFSSARNCIW